jgi:phage/plasmid-associated DNA primase
MDALTRFSKANRYMEFPLKALAIEFLRTLPGTSGAQLFAKDKFNENNPGAQTFIIAIAKAIYKRSVYALIEGRPTSFYEWMGDCMKIGDETVKNTIDIDMEGVSKARQFNEDIAWVVVFVSAAIEKRYKVVVNKDQWVVLKCDYDDIKQKHSAHLILHGFMWSCVPARKAFMESIGLVEAMAKRCSVAANPGKVIDAGVFGPKMLRLMKSTKLGKTLPLWGAKFDEFMIPDDSFAFFQKSMGSYTVDCQLLEGIDCLSPAISTACPRARAAFQESASEPTPTPETETDSIDRYAPSFDVLKTIVTALDQTKRFGKGSHDLWIEIGFAITNVGRTGGYETQAKKLFDDLSRAFPLIYNEGVIRNLVDKARDYSKRKGWTYLKSCLLEDNPSRYKEMFCLNDKTNMRTASPSQVTVANRRQPDNVTIIAPDVKLDTSKSLNELANFCANFHEMKSELEVALGFQNVSLLQEREAGFNFDADRECKCPLCTVATHGTSAYYCVQVMPKVFIVRNYASGCKQHMLGWDEHRQLQNLLLTPDSDAPYVDLFEAHFKRRLKWTGKLFLFFKDHLWRPIPTEEVYNTISSMANIMLERLLQSLAQRQIELDVQNGDKDAKKLNKEQYNGVLKGMKYIKRNSNVRGMVEMTKNRLISDVETTMNQNPYLLGAENGVLVLSPGDIHLRIGRPEDNISKSVRYEYFNEGQPFDEVVWRTFRDFIERIYPVEEDREVVQRFFGYCLLGHHPEKKLCLLTDARSGNNGKSTITKALRSALGEEYSIKAAPELLYKTDCSSTTINSHISGLLDFRGVRMAMIEELDAKKQLNNALMKDLNGGNSSLRGRECGQAKVNTMQWVTKMIMSFNNQCMPNFDYTDPALLSRFLIIQHRSRFFVDTEEFEANEGIPFSYRADPNIDKQILEWRPHMLKWCLIGLESYHTHGFRTVPKSCEDWKKQLVSKQDLVAEFVSERLVRTGVETDYVHRADLFSQFCLAYKDEQKDAKTQIKKKVFGPHINKLLGESCRKNKHDNFCDSYMGWKYTRREEC